MFFRRDRFLTSDDAAQVRRLTRRLRYFRFVCGTHGMGAEGDMLRVRLRHASLDDLLDLQIQVGLTPATSAAPPWSRRFSVKGIEVWASSTDQFLDLTIAGSDGDPYRVTENDVQLAQLIEPRLDALFSRVVDPPENSVRCISPAEYPEWFGREKRPLTHDGTSLRHRIDKVETSDHRGEVTTVKFSGRCRPRPATISDEEYLQQVLDNLLASRPMGIIVDLTGLRCDGVEVLAVPLPDVGGCLGTLRIPVSVVVDDRCASAVSRYAFGRSTDIFVEHIEWVFRSPAEAVESVRRRM